MLIVGTAVKGYAIEAKDGRIGSVSDLLFDDTTWKIRWLVIDTGTWLTTRNVLVHPSAIERVDHENQELSVMLSKRQIEDSPSILRDRPVSERMQSNLYDYYGWDPMWGGSDFANGAIASTLTPSMIGAYAAPEGQSLAPLEDEGDPHLRSVTEVKGYHIAGSDGEIGHVENLLLEDSGWNIRYLIVDTSNWWLGKHVLISRFAVRRINYSERQVEIDVTRAKVESSPPWDPVAMIDSYYEKLLHHHYGWPGYGW